LQDAQELGLEVSADLADLVQEQRAPSALSNRPALALAAPVKAPFSCPNSSDSSTPSARALALTATNGAPTRSEW